VDAVLTGIGTVLADDPRLTARDVHVRRTAARIVIDPRAAVPLDSALIRTIPDAPLIVVVGNAADRAAADALRQAGATVMEGPMRGPRIDLAQTLSLLLQRYGVHSVLVEAGPGLLSSLFDEDLICEAAVFIAPRLLGDPQATPPMTGRAPTNIASSTTLNLHSVHRRDGDVLLRYGAGCAARSTA